MNRRTRVTRSAVDNHACCSALLLQEAKVDTHRNSISVLWFLIVIMLSISVGSSVIAQELNLDKFRRMVLAESGKGVNPSDSIGSVLRVIGFGDPGRDFLLAPKLRDGKVVAVYKDDPKRNSITLLASSAVLRSVKPDLFQADGARRYLQEKGYTQGDPQPISIGPCSLFGVLETGWFLPIGDSYVVLSMEGRLMSEIEVGKFWSAKLPLLKQVWEQFRPKQ